MDSNESRLAPVLFVGHGAPTLALDPVKGAPLRAVGEGSPRPEAVLVVSAHWEGAPPTLGATTPQPLVYDFWGFPEPLYRVLYPAPGAPGLADRVEAALGPWAPRRDPKRGLELHGVRGEGDGSSSATVAERFRTAGGSRRGTARSSSASSAAHGHQSWTQTNHEWKERGKARTRRGARATWLCRQGCYLAAEMC